MLISMTSHAASGPLAELCKSATGAWVATVVSVGPPPAFFSGRAAAYQNVTYSVQQTLKGPPMTEQITVAHLVVKGSSTAEPGELPMLSKKAFRVGAQLVVIAEKDDSKHWICMDEVLGAAQPSPEWISKVSATCK